MGANESIYRLRNGVQLVYKQVAGSRVSYVGVAIEAGTRDERADEWGLAHYVEHTIFKGTEHYSAKEINDAVERLGGDLNAYTTKEMTVVHATVLNEGVADALRVIGEMMTQATFPSEELAKEANVIVDEIESANDSPDEKIYEDMEGLLFEGTSLGREILGSEKSVRGFRGADAQRWVRRQYRSEKMTVFALTALDEAEVRGMVESWVFAESEESVARVSEALGAVSGRRVERKMDTHQAYMAWGSHCPGKLSEDFYPLVLVSNLVGGPAISSWLYTALREDLGLAYSAEAVYSAYKDVGSLMVVVGTEKKNVAKCRKVVREQLARLEQVSEEELERAKRVLMGQVALSNDVKESVALSMAKNALQTGRTLSYDEVERHVRAVCVEDVKRVAGAYLNMKNMVELVYK